jgi:hypothetical protein
MLVTNLTAVMRCNKCGNLRNFGSHVAHAFPAEKVVDKITLLPCLECKSRPYMKVIAIQYYLANIEKVEVSKFWVRSQCTECNSVWARSIIIESKDEAIVKKSLDKHKVCHKSTCDGRAKLLSCTATP